MEKKVMMLKKLAKKIEHKLIVLLLLTLFSLISCYEEWEPADTASGDDDAIRLTYTISGAGLPTRFSAQGMFEDGDEVGIYMIPHQIVDAAALESALSSNQQAVSDASGNLSPRFKPPVGTSVNFVSYFPYRPTVNGYKIPVTLPANVYPVPDMGLLYANGVGREVFRGDAVDLNYQSAMCKLTMTAAAEDGYDLSMEGARLTITGIPTAADFNLRTGRMENFGGMGVEVPLQHSQNTSADTAHWEALIIPHLATDVAGDRVFTFTFAGNEERTWAVEDLEGNKLDFEAGQNYQYHFTVKEKTITTTTSDSMSNCYMVKPNTTLKFPVTRAYADSTNLRTGDAFADGTFKVKVIWADVSGLLTSPTTTLSNVSGTGPTAEVSVTAAAGKTGNAVIGIYKSTDTDTPVWSYHIWVTDPDDIITYTNQYTYSDTEYKFRFMDRNLGATAAGLGSGKGTGLFYQWGRKDPFPATGAPGDNQAEGKFTATDVSATTGTIVYTIKYPNIFIYQGGTSNSGDWHWGMRDNTLWGHNDVKSIYDPCPTGWRVPVNINMSSDTSPWFSYTSANGGTWANGYTWDGNNFPACGRRWGDRDAGILGTVGSFGRYWTASPYSLKSTTAANMGITYGTCNVYATGGDRAMGFSVRCVLEY